MLVNVQLDRAESTAALIRAWGKHCQLFATDWFRCRRLWWSHWSLVERWTLRRRTWERRWMACSQARRAYEKINFDHNDCHVVWKKITHTLYGSFESDVSVILNVTLKETNNKWVTLINFNQSLIDFLESKHFWSIHKRTGKLSLANYFLIDQLTSTFCSN